MDREGHTASDGQGRRLSRESAATVEKSLQSECTGCNDGGGQAHEYYRVGP